MQEYSQRIKLGQYVINTTVLFYSRLSAEQAGIEAFILSLVYNVIVCSNIVVFC